MNMNQSKAMKRRSINEWHMNRQYSAVPSSRRPHADSVRPARRRSLDRASGARPSAPLTGCGVVSLSSFGGEGQGEEAVNLNQPARSIRWGHLLERRPEAQHREA